MLAQIERYLTQAVVDKMPFVASAALVSGLHLTKHHPEVVKRWVNEVSQAASDKRGPMVQYHALALLYSIKQNDRLAVSKLVSQLSKQQLRSPLAQCLLIHYTANVMATPTRVVVSTMNSSSHVSVTSLRWSSARPLGPSATCRVSLSASLLPPSPFSSCSSPPPSPLCVSPACGR
mmetsp:Transcript_8511/g.18535  ORF Transcript_8511/g.18535 Transcript_8511/m.18535 type:complete len:176 (-) Transcript_8511:1793-2320(-)